MQRPVALQAAFCYEELLLMAPLAVNNLTRYADVLYTLGGPQNYRCVALLCFVLRKNLPSLTGAGGGLQWHGRHSLYKCQFADAEPRLICCGHAVLLTALLHYCGG